MLVLVFVFIVVRRRTLFLLFFLLFALLREGQVKLGFFVVGVQTQGLFEGIDAFVQFIELKKGIAKVVVGCRFVRRGSRFFGRIFIPREGFLIAFLLVDGVAEVVLAWELNLKLGKIQP